MINVFLNLHLKNLTIKILAFWLKNRSGFFLFIHKVDYRTLKTVRITLKELALNTHVSSLEIS